MSLVNRLLLLIVLAMVPVLAGQVYTHVELQSQRKGAMRADAARYTRLVSADAERLIEGARGVLIAVSEAPSVLQADALVCPQYLARLARRYPEILNITLIDETAKPICANTPIPATATARDRFYYHEARRTNDFVIGTFIAGRTVAAPQLPIAIPFIDDAGRAMVLSIGLDLIWLQQHFASLPLPAGASLWVADRNGTVVVAPSNPAQVGHLLPPDLRPALRPEAGVFERLGEDGTAHIVAFDPTTLPPVGLAIAVDLAQKDLALSAEVGSARDFAVLFVSVSIAALLAWFGATRLVNRPLHIVTSAAREWANGRYDVRARLRDRTSEIGRLGLAFDSMADAIQANQRALETLNQTLESRVEERTGELSTANRKLEFEMAERLKAEADLRQAQKMDAIGQLAGGIAHDFNNLLTGIGGSIDFIARALPKGEIRAHRFASLARDAVERAARLTHRLLAFAHHQPLEVQIVEVNQVVAGMAELLTRTLGAAITIETILHNAGWSVRCDSVQLENALLNLAVNARDAMPHGGRLTIAVADVLFDDPTAHTNGITPGEYVELAVADTGAGMSRDTIARAFDPFFTTKPVGKGTGLGLSMVYGFAKQSGGHVRIESEIGRGTTVRFYLPRASAAATSGHAPPERPPSRPGHETILVVEDDAAVREMSTAILCDLGYVVLTAADAETALEILTRNPSVAVLFADIVLTGGIDGRSLAAKALQLCPGIRVLYTTGYTPTTITLDPGVNLLPKPFTPEALAAKLVDVFDS